MIVFFKLTVVIKSTTQYWIAQDRGRFRSQLIVAVTVVALLHKKGSNSDRLRSSHSSLEVNAHRLRDKAARHPAIVTKALCPRRKTLLHVSHPHEANFLASLSAPR